MLLNLVMPISTTWFLHFKSVADGIGAKEISGIKKCGTKIQVLAQYAGIILGHVSYKE